MRTDLPSYYCHCLTIMSAPSHTTERPLDQTAPAPNEKAKQTCSYCDRQFKSLTMHLARNRTCGEKAASKKSPLNHPRQSAPEPSIPTGIDDEPIDAGEKELPPIGTTRYAYPRPAGTPLRPCKTDFEKFHQQQQEKNVPIHAPYASMEEWNLTDWILRSGISQCATDELLKLPMVRQTST